MRCSGNKNKYVVFKGFSAGKLAINILVIHLTGCLSRFARLILLCMIATSSIVALSACSKGSETAEVEGKNPKAVSAAYNKTLNAGIAAFESANYAEALQLLKPIAEKGVTESQFVVAKMYEKGQGVKKDYATAFNWYEKAANQEHAEAQYALASLYAYGYGVAQDYAKASEWSIKADNNGYGKVAEPPKEPGRNEKTLNNEQ